MARTERSTARTSSRGQTENDSGMRQQIDVPIGWPKVEGYEIPVGQLGAELRGPERSPVDG
jgi:hypothetical protein